MLRILFSGWCAGWGQISHSIYQTRLQAIDFCGQHDYEYLPVLFIDGVNFRGSLNFRQMGPWEVTLAASIGRGPLCPLTGTAETPGLGTRPTILTPSVRVLWKIFMHINIYIVEYSPLITLK